MEAREQIERLVRLQKVAIEMRDATAVIEAAPGRIEESEARFRERNAEYVELKDRHDELERENRERNLELKSLEESRDKFQADLMQVQNQREYAAILKEIDTVKARISDHEDRILANDEEIETLREDIKARSEHIEAEREIVAKERTDVEAGVAEAERTVERARAERATIEAGMPDWLLAAVGRVERSRQGVFLVEARDATCQACYVRVRPQAFQEIKLGTALHACSSCRRFLYWPGTLDGGGSTDASDAPDTEAGDASATGAASHGA